MRSRSGSRLAERLVSAVLVGAMLFGCGGGDDEPASRAGPKITNTSSTSTTSAPSAAETASTFAPGSVVGDDQDVLTQEQVTAQFQNLGSKFNIAVAAASARGNTKGPLLVDLLRALSAQVAKDAFDSLESSDITRFSATPKTVVVRDVKILESSFGCVRAVAIVDGFAELDRDLEPRQEFFALQRVGEVWLLNGFHPDENKLEPRC